MNTYRCTEVLKMVPEHRTLVKTVFDAVKYLAVNDQLFRGDSINVDFQSDFFGGRLYLNTYSDIVLKKDNELEKIAKKTSQNAKYTSPSIQNEIIDVIHSVFKQKIADKV